MASIVDRYFISLSWQACWQCCVLRCNTNDKQMHDRGTQAAPNSISVPVHYCSRLTNLPIVQIHEGKRKLAKYHSCSLKVRTLKRQGVGQLYGCLRRGICSTIAWKPMRAWLYCPYFSSIQLKILQRYVVIKKDGFYFLSPSFSLISHVHYDTDECNHHDKNDNTDCGCLHM